MTTIAEDERRKAAIERLKAKRSFWQDLATYVVVNAFVIGVWALTGGGYFWPAWLLGAWGIGVVLHGWTAFVMKPISEDQIEAEMARDGGAVARSEDPSDRSSAP